VVTMDAGHEYGYWRLLGQMFQRAR